MGYIPVPCHHPAGRTHDWGMAPIFFFSSVEAYRDRSPQAPPTTGGRERGRGESRPTHAEADKGQRKDKDPRGQKAPGGTAPNKPQRWWQETQPRGWQAPPGQSGSEPSRGHPAGETPTRRGQATPTNPTKNERTGDAAAGGHLARSDGHDRGRQRQTTADNGRRRLPQHDPHRRGQEEPYQPPNGAQPNPNPKPPPPKEENRNRAPRPPQTRPASRPG